MNNAINIENLLYSWPGRASPVIRIPHWEVSSGERVFIYGPSGSGKSTLLNLLAGILLPQQGDIQVLGHSLPQLGHRARDRFRAQQIGMIFQQFNLLPYLSVEDNIALARHFGKSAGNKNKLGALGSDTHKLLERLALSADLLTRRASELSVGQQQRVAVARALINKPQLIIADEPSSALDSGARDDFLALLLDCARQNNSTVVFVSHDRSIAGIFDSVVDMAQLNKLPVAAGQGMHRENNLEISLEREDAV